MCSLQKKSFLRDLWANVCCSTSEALNGDRDHRQYRAADQRNSNRFALNYILLEWSPTKGSLNYIWHWVFNFFNTHIEFVSERENQPKQRIQRVLWLLPASDNRLKKGSWAKKEKANGNCGITKRKKPKTGHSSVGNPPKERRGDCVGQPKHLKSHKDTMRS